LEREMALMNAEKKVMVRLNLNESGFLCNLMMEKIAGSDVPQWAVDLYGRLANANDRLMREMRGPKRGGS
jgi:hypothetical protein